MPNENMYEYIPDPYWSVAPVICTKDKGSIIVSVGLYPDNDVIHRSDGTVFFMPRTSFEAFRTQMPCCASIAGCFTEDSLELLAIKLAKTHAPDQKEVLAELKQIRELELRLEGQGEYRVNTNPVFRP